MSDMSEANKLQVYVKLQKARIALQGEKLTKTGHNSYSGYDYFELRDFLPTVQRIFSEIGLCGVVAFTSDVAHLTIIDTEFGGQVFFTSPMASAALKGCHEVQNVGAVETYQRRYLWVTAMEIVEHDALDATTGKDKPASAKSTPKDVFDNMDAELRQWLENIAMDVKKHLHQGRVKEAYDRIEKEKLESDERVGLWSRFDSKERSALTKYGQDVRKKAEQEKQNPHLEKIPDVDTSKLDKLLDDLAEAAGRGHDEFHQLWNGLTPQERAAVGDKRYEDLATIAAFTLDPKR